MRFSRAMVCARSTFLAVMGKNAPAFTVASLAMIMHRRPQTRPSPVTTPAPGAPPYSLYIPYAAQRPNSNNSVPSSRSRLRRSLTVSRPLARWASAALGPPPRRMESSSVRSTAINSLSAVWFVTARGDCESSFDRSLLSNLRSFPITPSMKIGHENCQTIACLLLLTHFADTRWPILYCRATEGHRPAYPVGFMSGTERGLRARCVAIPAANSRRAFAGQSSRREPWLTRASSVCMAS